MAKLTRPYSRYSRDAAVLLGQLIRLARIGRKLTHGQLAERARVSRGLVHRIEKGDPGCAIGAVFEVAAIVGVRLFDADQSTLATGIAANTATLALLPTMLAAVRRLSSSEQEVIALLCDDPVQDELVKLATLVADHIADRIRVCALKDRKVAGVEPRLHADPADDYVVDAAADL